MATREAEKGAVKRTAGKGGQSPYLSSIVSSQGQKSRQCGR